MSNLLRIEIFLVAVLFFFFVVRAINKNIFSLSYAFAWLVTSVILVVFSIFPKVPVYLSSILGFETPMNFMVLMGVFFLLAVCLQNTIVISKQQEKIKNLIQELSIFKSESKEDK